MAPLKLMQARDISPEVLRGRSIRAEKAIAPWRPLNAFSHTTPSRRTSIRSRLLRARMDLVTMANVPGKIERG